MAPPALDMARDGDAVDDAPSTAAQQLADGNEAPSLQLAVSAVGPTSAIATGGHAPSPGRSMTVSSLLNDAADDIVDGSEPQDESERDSNMNVDETREPTVGNVGRGTDTSPAEILLTLHRQPSAPEHAETGASEASEQPPDMRLRSDGAVEAETILNGDTQHGSGNDGPSPQLDPVEPAPQTPPETRQRTQPARSTRASSRARAQSSEAVPSAAAVVAPPSQEAATAAQQEEDLSLDNNTRPKRRPPPRSTRPAPAKKTKPTPPPARPKRAAQVKATLSDMMMIDDDEYDDDSAVLVIADHDVKKSQIVTPLLSASAPSVATPSTKVKKRKGISERQYEELINDDRRSKPLSAEELQGVDSRHSSLNKGPRMGGCEFCRLRTTAQTLFRCRACKRHYHGKCFVQAYHPQVDQDRPLEEQMDQLRLWRPADGTSVLRCGSCCAAFVELAKHRGFKWDCQCPTCTDAAEKASDYRRVALKQIVDEHNVQIAEKREAEAKRAATAAAGAAPQASKQPAAKASKTKKPSAAQDAPPMAAPPAMAKEASTRSRRTRGEPPLPTDEPVVSEAPPPSPPPPPKQKPAPKPKPTPPKPKAPKVDRRAASRKKPARGKANGSKDDDAEAMEVEVEDAPEVVVRVKVEEPNPLASLTREQLDERFGITHDGDKTVMLTIACTPSLDRTQSGSYKEALFSWQPSRAGTVTCSCCAEAEMPLRQFVNHTDAALLQTADSASGDDGINDFYPYLFAVEKSQELVPLQWVTAVLRTLYAAQPARRGGSKRGKPAPPPPPPIDAATAESSFVGELQHVVFQRKEGVSRPSGRSARTAVAEFVCEVVCVQDRYLHPKKFNEGVLSLQLDSVSQDIYKRGLMEVMADPGMRGPQIRCLCCDNVFSRLQLESHTAASIIAVRESTKEILQKQESDLRARLQILDAFLRGRTPDTYEEDMQDEDFDAEKRIYVLEGEAAHVACELEKLAQPVKYSVVVPLRDRNTVLTVHAFNGAIMLLGDQPEVNQAIATIFAEQSKPGAL